jgi:hypothetical protein
VKVPLPVDRVVVGNEDGSMGEEGTCTAVVAHFLLLGVAVLVEVELGRGTQHQRESTGKDQDAQTLLDCRVPWATGQEAPTIAEQA